MMSKLVLIQFYPYLRHYMYNNTFYQKFLVSLSLVCLWMQSPQVTKVWQSKLPWEIYVHIVSGVRELEGKDDVVGTQLLTCGLVAGEALNPLTSVWTARSEPTIFPILLILESDFDGSKLCCKSKTDKSLTCSHFYWHLPVLRSGRCSWLQDIASTSSAWARPRLR